MRPKMNLHSFGDRTKVLAQWRKVPHSLRGECSLGRWLWVTLGPVWRGNWNLTSPALSPKNLFIPTDDPRQFESLAVRPGLYECIAFDAPSRELEVGY